MPLFFVTSLALAFAPDRALVEDAVSSHACNLLRHFLRHFPLKHPPMPAPPVPTLASPPLPAPHPEPPRPTFRPLTHQPRAHGCTLSCVACLWQPALPSGWTVQGPSPRNLTLELHFAVKQHNLDQLHDTLMAVSTPSSPSYGNHLTNDAVHALVAPAADDLAAVRAHLATAGARAFEASPNGDMLLASVSVAQAEALLGGATYMQMYHAATGVTVHRLRAAYHLPSRVAAAVDFVAPTVHVPG
eukprot:5561527-Prymnesium_polylepis.1